MTEPARPQALTPPPSTRAGMATPARHDLEAWQAPAGTRLPPSLMWRVVWVVMAGFAVIFVVLLAWIGYASLGRESGEFDRGMLASAQGLAKALNEVDSDAGAQAAVALFSAMIASSPNGAADGEPALDVSIVRFDGQVQRPGKLAPQLDLRGLRDGVVQQTVDGQNLRLYVASEGRWKAALVDLSDVRARWAMKMLALELLMYLGAALPIVLIPVWLTVRAALGPLRRLSDALAQRSLIDSRPLTAPTPYRELLPLQAALNRLFERVGSGLAREKSFVNDAAHEMRTPLAVISTQAHLLAASEGAGREEARVRLQSAIERASHLTQQLLRLAQADATAQALRQPVDVMNVARDALASFVERAAVQQSELSLEGPDNLLVHSERQGLRSVFENLIDNALRYGGPGVAVEVRVVASQAPGATQWQLWVADDGPGIAVAQRAQVFERFWRGHHDHSRGAGLGLAIVQEVARSLGGDVHIEDGLRGKGCAFVVRMP
jgi:two-component system, OmpR family, sensor histidine kinase QseC